MFKIFDFFIGLIMEDFMENKKKIRNHPVLDHTVLGYFLLILWVQVITSFGSLIDNPLGNVIPGYGSSMEVMGFTIPTTTGIGTAVFAVIALLIHKLWFAPNYKGALSKDLLIKGILMLAPLFVCHGIGSLVSCAVLGFGNIGIAALRALAPGFGEEVMFRGLGISNFMRTIKDEKKIPLILWLSAIVFGFAHMSNSVVGASLTTSLIQSLYAMGIGLAFGAVYLRTGNLWPSIIAHYLIDFLEFCRADLSSSNGIMGELTIGDHITLVVGFLAIFWGCYLCRKSKRAEIMAVWQKKWNKQEEI